MQKKHSLTAMPKSIEKRLKKFKRKYLSWIKDREHAAYNRTQQHDVHYVTATMNWSVRHDGECLMSNLAPLDGALSPSPLGIEQGIIHYGGVADAFRNKKFITPPKGRPYGITWFHISENDKRLKYVGKLDQDVEFWHSSCSRTIDTLIEHGASPEKTHVIPLGVDTKAFHPLPAQEKQAKRGALGIPDDAIVIGSFQKDGTGWDDGMKPKSVKAPHIFCDVVIELNKTFNIFVLLTGPARGYVKSRLDEANVPYYSAGFLDHANDVIPYFQLIDFYLITSIIEGGPKALLEASACKAPLVTTNVGMVRDLFIHNESAMIADVNDKDALLEHCTTLINDKALYQKISCNAYNIAQNNSWQNIAQRYYDELYKPIIDKQ